MARILIASFVGGVSSFMAGLLVLLMILWRLEDCDSGCAGGVGEVAFIILAFFAAIGIVEMLLLVCLVMSRCKFGILNLYDFIVSVALWMSPLSLALLACLLVNRPITDPALWMVAISPALATTLGAVVCWKLLGDIRFHKSLNQ